MFTAHLDTVFPEGTDVRVKRDGAILRGPGIGDDCRGLAVLLAVVRAMNQAKVQTPGSITFVVGAKSDRRDERVGPAGAPAPIEWISETESRC